ncbi:phosphoketolase [Ferrovibrio sp.]|uniref:phosphoketolase family protein n=1 Tax=Ferrovibrio sp. TaxID=1917215 RepID=UPI0035AE86ED
MSQASEDFTALDLYWRAANYLSIGQIYLLRNPLLRQPLTANDIKPRPLGHWGTAPGLNFITAHLNRIIRRTDRRILQIVGPGHGAPAVVAGAYLEGVYSELFPDVGQNAEGMAKLFRQFSFPHGVPSHASPQTPGSIHEGGELGYALSHAYGAAFDNPDLLVACIIGDGEAETGPLAAAWHSNKFLNPARDGAVLPILHLNGYKIANPTILSRLPEAELLDLMHGYGYKPYVVAGDDHAAMHRQMAAAMDAIFARIDAIQQAARRPDAIAGQRPLWPMLILRSPKGWTGPAEVDGLPNTGTWRAHQVPIPNLRGNENHRAQFQQWLLSYKPDELFDAEGAPRAWIEQALPRPERRMSGLPEGNGGLLLRDLHLPDFRAHALDLPKPGRSMGEATRQLGFYLRDVLTANAQAQNIRLFSPDEAASNHLDAVFQVTDRGWMADRLATDDHLAADGRVMEILSEHTCQGWLEGYLLTGRHGLFATYEAFVHVVDSMFNQHAKWLQVCNEVPWRKPVASLNYLLSSHVWHQDHNGFSHQDPGFLDLVANKNADVIRIYLPPDANTLLAVGDHCLRSRNRINVVVAGKHPQLQWLDMPSAIEHCAQGIGAWAWAGHPDAATGPAGTSSAADAVLACAGDVPTIETMAAAALLRQHLPDLRLRVVNVVDLMRLQPADLHPHGMTDAAFDALFTIDKPVIFAFHGYAALVHRLVYRRRNHANFHVHGYREQGTTTTPFDMTVINQLDRYHLVLALLKRLPDMGAAGTKLRNLAEDRLAAHHAYIGEHGEDMPEISSWAWPY